MKNYIFENQFNIKVYDSKLTYLTDEELPETLHESYALMPQELSPLSEIDNSWERTLDQENNVLFKTLLDRIKNNSVEFYSINGSQRIIPKIIFSLEDKGPTFNWVGKRFRMFFSSEDGENYFGYFEKGPEGEIASYLNNLNMNNVLKIADYAFDYVVNSI